MVSIAAAYLTNAMLNDNIIDYYLVMLNCHGLAHIGP